MAGQVMEIKHQIDAALRDPSKPWAQVFGKIEQATGINRTYVFLGAAVFTAVWLVFGFAAQLVCNSVGFIYPAYASIHAIESARTDDDKKWLTYWVVFAIFSVLEFFVDILTGWIPLYWFMKCVFMVWLMIPTELNGSIILYNRVIRPYFLKHHRQIDQTLNRAAQEGKKQFLRLVSEIHVDDPVKKIAASKVFDKAHQ